MKILILGTGVIGTLYAYALSKHHDITHFVREDKMKVMNGKTIPYDIIDERNDKKNMNTEGEYTYKCVTEVTENYDFIILPVNTYQLEEAIKTLVKKASNAKFLIFTLNWGGTYEIDKLLRKEQYIMGYAGGGGTFKGDLLWANIGNDISLGSVYEVQKPLLEVVVRAFKDCRIEPEIPSNILHWLWVHNVGSAPLGVGLSKYNNLDELLKDKKLTKICFRAMIEGYKICERKGVNLKDYPEVKMMSMPFFLLYPMFRRNFKKNPIMQRYTAHALKAIDEMKDNFKGMLKTGKDLNMSIPNMEMISKLL
ncbi:putative ketopantoate reductase PanE/ApbA [Clostridium acetobutylicum EA 2018]|uniref:ketopantoate reductase family protein n=1 Tax=Clostridium acetobutylicum TaxID=1488 RepID=UPI000200C14A|nr:ketopantoate reductase family protein [Clostridium acetobutylicum]ADZ22651.1 putative ketopantoate reductase PanE/ApbA [Clostridium acetobutylicum EA 2018]